MVEKNSQLLTILCILLFSFAKLSNSLPLSTSSRWIVDDKSGNRVKLTCVNWPGHLEPLVVEGLQKKPLTFIVKNIALMGFNCVRLTWATFMFTRENYRCLTVRESLNHFSLNEAIAGIAKNNPQLLNVTVVEVQKAVVNELGRNNIMVVLDNHVSQPQWCCGQNDGNGFFGDAFFDPKEWLQGLSTVAKLYKDSDNVVAMSMRNELRGPHQNTNDWYQYIPQGAAAIHGENPSVLVIVSGLSYATDLRFIKEKPLVLNLTNKLVYEAHWYSFGSPRQMWLSQTNQICTETSRIFMENSAFVVSNENNPVPLFLSEFGVDQRGGNDADNRYLSCLMAFIAEYDLDWCLWALQGSYILRQGVVELNEVYGMFDVNWDGIRNSTIQQRLQLVKQIIQDPKSTNPKYFKLYHPQSGLCARIEINGSVHGSDCQCLASWKQKEDGNSTQLMGTFGCLRATEDGHPVTVSSDCGNHTTFWKLVSSSKLHIATQDKQGGYLCLELNSSDSMIVTKKCLCLDENSNDVPNCAENPERQWFKLIPTNKS